MRVQFCVIVCLASLVVSATEARAQRSIIVGGFGYQGVSSELTGLGYAHDVDSRGQYALPVSETTASNYDIVIVSEASIVGSGPDYTSLLNAGANVLIIGGQGDMHTWLAPYFDVIDVDGTSHDSNSCSPDWTKGAAHPVTQYMPATDDSSAQLSATYNEHEVHIDAVQTANVAVLGTTCHGGANNASLVLRDYSNLGLIVYANYNLMQDPDVLLSGLLQGFVENAQNEAPVAGDDSGVTEEDTTLTIDVLANDTDRESASLTLAAVGAPGNGSAAVVSGNIEYTPDPDFNGTDTFAYTVSDEEGLTATGTVTVTVTPVNDSPVFVAPTPAYQATLRVVEGDALTMTLAAEDVDGDTLSFATDPMPTGAVIDASTGDFEWMPTWEDIGSVGLTLEVTDGVETVTRPISVVVGMLDEDGDGLSDGKELADGLDPTTDDTDADGVLDGDDDCPLEWGEGADGCPEGGQDDVGPDAGTDAGPDAGADAGPDAGSDAGSDAGGESDGGLDAGSADANGAADVGGAGSSDGTDASSGCGCSASGGTPASGALLLLVIGLVALRMPRRRRFAALFASIAIIFGTGCGGGGSGSGPQPDAGGADTAETDGAGTDTDDFDAGASCVTDEALIAEPRNCRLDNDCACGAYCDLGACTYDCLTDSDCSGGETCSDFGRCVAAEEPGAGIVDDERGELDVRPRLLPYLGVGESVRLELRALNSAVARARIVASTGLEVSCADDETFGPECLFDSPVAADEVVTVEVRSSEDGEERRFVSIFTAGRVQTVSMEAAPDDPSVNADPTGIFEGYLQPVEEGIDGEQLRPLSGAQTIPLRAEVHTATGGVIVLDEATGWLHPQGQWIGLFEPSTSGNALYLPSFVAHQGAVEPAATTELVISGEVEGLEFANGGSSLQFELIRRMHGMLPDGRGPAVRYRAVFNRVERLGVGAVAPEVPDSVTTTVDDAQIHTRLSWEARVAAEISNDTPPLTSAQVRGYVDAVRGAGYGPLRYCTNSRQRLRDST
ncbi:MAG: Ig-like domain-containing protein, partial [Myxococcota bacterium]